MSEFRLYGDRESLRAMRRLGRASRIQQSIWAVLLDGSVWIGLHNGLPLWSALLVGVPATLAAVLSWRISVRLTDDAIVVTTYVRRRIFRFTDVRMVYDVAYAGFWNRYTALDGWLGLGARMLEIARFDGRSISLPATLCARGTSEPLAEYLSYQAWLRTGGTSPAARD
jgi:hypothetical protein